MNLSTDLVEQARATELYPFLGSRTNQWKLRRDGELPFIKSAGKIFYRISDIEQYIDSRRHVEKEYSAVA